MRIITGIYKGRHFDIPRTFKARPTTDFAKENIFNVLMAYTDLDGARALDLFAGTGSITMEMLSRGCNEVVSIEMDRDHHRFICSCLAKLGEEATKKVKCIRGDVFRYIRDGGRKATPPFDIIFADPPYALKELPDIPELVLGSNMLVPGGLFVFEHGKDHDFCSHPLLIDHRVYGSVNFSIFKAKANQETST